MQKETFVYIDLNGTTYYVGQLWTHVGRGRESATFEYANSWLQNSNRFALDPALLLVPGPQHTAEGKSLFGALGDSAPDRWGRILMRRAERHKVGAEKRPLRTLMEIDYLLLVNDELRQGALRFAAKEGGPFLSNDARKVPPLIELPKLLSATEHLTEDKETDEDLKLLLAPGSSLGGARPKASVRDRDGTLAFAKFPNVYDEYNVVLWEALSLKLAEKAKLIVPQWRIEMVAGKAVLLIKRFDRRSTGRIPFLSAMSMLGAKDNEARSYLEIVDVIRQYGADPVEDIKRLWRRIVFNIMISNTDDHLRNHGFLYVDQLGWCLSPVYDLNPTPLDIKPRVLSTMIDFDDGTASLELALSVAEYFNLNFKAAKDIAFEVANAVSTWEVEASGLGIKKTEIVRMRSAFKHEDLTAGLQKEK